MICPKCEKETSRFWKGTCGSCYSRQWRIDNPEAAKEKDRKCHAKNQARRNEYSRTWNREHRDLITTSIWEKQARVDAIKINKPCQDCGNKFPAECMDFDHLPGTQKILSISRMAADNLGWETILNEIAKCELVCANCHRTRTKNRYTPRRQF